MPGYSGTPLAAKLGYKPGMLAWLHEAPDDYRRWLEPLPAGVRFESAAGARTRLHHLFVTRRDVLENLLPRLLATMPRDAVIWVSWPKKSSKLASEITEDSIRDIALPLDLVDIKVCAVSEVWSGLKLMLRREARGNPPSKPNRKA